MIARLRRECGYQYTLKLEGMFKDIGVSKEENARFHSHVADLPEEETQTAAAAAGAVAPLKPSDLYVSVLTTGYWPFTNTSVAKLPQSVASTLEQFKS